MHPCLCSFCFLCLLVPSHSNFIVSNHFLLEGSVQVLSFPEIPLWKLLPHPISAIINLRSWVDLSRAPIFLFVFLPVNTWFYDVRNNVFLIFQTPLSTVVIQLLHKVCILGMQRVLPTVFTSQGQLYDAGCTLTYTSAKTSIQIVQCGKSVSRAWN